MVRVNPSTNYRFLGEQILSYFGTKGDLGRVGRAWASGSKPTAEQKRNAARELRAIRTSKGSMTELAQEIILDALTARSNPSKGKTVSQKIIRRRVYVCWIGRREEIECRHVGYATSAAEANKYGLSYPASAKSAMSSDGFFVPIARNKEELKLLLYRLSIHGYSSIEARNNPSKNMPKKTTKKPAAKRSGTKAGTKAPSKGKKRDLNFVDGGFVSDHTGEIYKVVRSGDDKVAVKDFEGNGFTFDKTDLQKMKNAPLMPRTKVMVHGTPHTILTHRFVGIVSARDDNTGKWSQYPISAVHPIASGARSSRTATTIRENPIRTKEGRVLVARGTRAQAKKFFDMRKKMLAMGLTPPARIKIRGGWMTYESASWVFRHGPAGSSTKGSTKPRKRSETTARKPRKSSGGRSAPTDPISHMNRTLGLG